MFVESNILSVINIIIHLFFLNLNKLFLSKIKCFFFLNRKKLKIEFSINSFLSKLIVNRT